MSDTVEFCGEQFRIGERVGMMPLMRYARMAKRAHELERSGQAASGEDELEAMDATLTLLEQCVHPDDWSRFERVTTAAGTGMDGYLEFAGQVMAAIAARPTGRSSDSSDGPRTIEPSSTDDSSSPVIDRLNGQGRPDLALLVRKRQESLSA